MMPSLQILQGDCLEMLKTLADESVHCCVTSPPYWGLRDYGVAGQIGLEPTPEAYVAKIVEVFREVRRVLRSDGTCWINLGSSYAGGGGFCESAPSTASSKSGKYGTSGAEMKSPGMTKGFKPKDMVPIPWMVAMALQKPYYTGTIQNIEDRIWLAAMIDAEGCMFIHKRKAGQNNGQGYERQNDSYGPGLEVANTSEAVVKRCLEIVGKGSICSQTPAQNNRRKQTIYRWNLRLVECREIIRELYPHFTAKQHQARIICGCPSSGPEADAAHQSLIALHNGGTATIDFPAPKTMFEKGWYLRQDIIWNKCNPMPESVTDRCTKAHEYVFLLSKSATYFYDAEAVREPSLDTAGVHHVDEDGTKHFRAAWNEKKGLDKKTMLASWASKNGSSVSASGRNRRSVWTIPSQAYSEAHFATYPEDLVKPCILAGTSARGCCPKCDAPWERVVEPTPEYAKLIGKSVHDHKFDGVQTGMRQDGKGPLSGDQTRAACPNGTYKTVGWKPTCDHRQLLGAMLDAVPCTVLDPFGGSCTTGQVALEFGRNAVLIELNPDYVALGRKRCHVTPSLPLS